MKEIESIIASYHQMKNSGEKAALAQVVRVEDSSYRREGARMIVYESGKYVGGISGGCLEGDALKRSQHAIAKNTSSVVTYDTLKMQNSGLGVGLGCDGVIDVLITPLEATSNVIPTLEKIVAERKSHVLVTVTEASIGIVGCQLGDRFLYIDSKNRFEALDFPELENVLLTDVSSANKQRRSIKQHYKINDEAISVFIEYIPAPVHLAIYGDNYDVYPLVDIAQTLGWKVSVVGKIEKLNKDRLSYVKQFYPKEETSRPNIDDRTAAILMAHDYVADKANYAAAIDSSAPYIAVLGPKKRFEKIKDELAEKISFEILNADRIHAPAGLRIGASSPEEIALSICSEIVAVFADQEGGKLREKNGPIHERILQFK